MVAIRLRAHVFVYTSNLLPVFFFTTTYQHLLYLLYKINQQSFNARATYFNFVRATEQRRYQVWFGLIHYSAFLAAKAM